MITINEISINEKSYLKGFIGKTPYSVENTEKSLTLLKEAAAEVNAAESFEDVNNIYEQTLKALEEVKADGNDMLLKEVLKDDLYFNEKTEQYHVKYEGKIFDKPVHKFFVDKMIEANDKGLDPKPWLIFWVRLMRNDLFYNNDFKVQRLISYLSAPYLDKEAADKLVEEGYSNNIAEQLSTFDQISITEQGILAAFKYVRLINEKFVVEKDEETGEQRIVSKPRYERKLEVDENTGEITKDELDLPEYAEDILFEPPVMGKSGDAFLRYTIDEDKETAEEGHFVSVGMIHELPEGFKQVNTDDNSWAVPGLHLGGYYYVQGFGGRTDYLVDCLVAPEDIGAVADIRESNQEGAIRCKRYYVVGAHFKVSKGMYHPSEYAKLLDDEWVELKKELIKKKEAEIAELKDRV